MSLPTVLINKILVYTYEPRYKFLDWIDPTALDFSYLSRNPRATQYLKKNFNKIDWEELSRNTSWDAIKLYLNYHNRPKHNYLSTNNNILAVETIIKNCFSNINLNLLSNNTNDIIVDYVINNICPKMDCYGSFWSNLSCNNNIKVVNYLLDKQDKIISHSLSKNSNTKAVDFLLKHQYKIYWCYFNLNENPKAINFLIRNPQRINWYFLSSNCNDVACDLLLLNKDKIDLLCLVSNINPKIIPILKENLDLINMKYFSENPLIFEIDKQATNIFFENKLLEIFKF